MRRYIVPPIPRSIWQKPSHFIAFGFGTGAIPIAPGTFGTLIAIPFYLLIRPLPLLGYIFVVLLISIASIWVLHRTSEEIKIHDHQGMCLDEIVGYLVAMINAPFGLSWIVLGFILFRVFDIWKPWPINYIDKKVTGGFGMVLDDMLAGLYTLIFINFVGWII